MRAVPPIYDDLSIEWTESMSLKIIEDCLVGSLSLHFLAGDLL